jgi:D-alanine-D-alanine ligase-like ATP-grasp enzyme
VRAFLKVNKAKYLTATVELEDGLGDCVVVQEFATVEREYRCIVIGGHVVSGAGVVAAHMALDRRTAGT